MALSVGEIAELIRRDDADRAAVVERLRVWSADGLLTPEGAVNVGTGRARLYDESTVLRAAALNAAADYGLQVRKGEYSKAWHMVNLMVDQAAAIWAKHKGDVPLQLEVADFGKPDRFGRRFFVFLHQGRGKKGHIGDLIHPKAESAHVIDLCRLFKRVEDRRAEAAEATDKQRKR